MRADLARVVAVIAVACIAPGSATRADEAPAEEVARVGAVRMQARALAPRDGDRELQFTRVDGSRIGLDRPNDYSIRDLYTPFWNGRGLAAGDIDRDGWPDLAVAGDRGVWIFMNRGGERFERRALDIPELASREIFAVALVDLDDDGWLDIFTTSWREGNAWVRSETGEFRREGLRAAPAGQQNLTQALSFGDLDRDGDLDAVAGNWYAGWETRFPPDRAANVLYRNDGGQLAQEVMQEIPGETLTLLLSDFTGDDHLDLIVGNDFGVSDQYYAGDGRGGLVPFVRGDGRIPVTTFSTMSIDTADLDNDLDLDVYLTQIAARATGAAADISAGGRPWSRYCEDLEPGPGRDRCVRNIDEGRLLFRFLSRFRPSLAQSCRKIADPERRVECLSLMTLLSADREKAPALCQRIPETEARLRQQCRDHFVRIPRPDPEAMSRSIPQRMNENVLLIAAGDDRFEDQASARGVGFTGWSWTGRFHDLDTDGWQDLYVVAGTMARDVRAGTAGNSFFRSVRGETFVEEADARGLQNFMIVSAYVALDVDRDGDLDLITNSINGPLWVHRNEGTRGNSVSFELRDSRANHYCIGCKLRIRLAGAASGASEQMRELKLGGGYLSFDEPVLHFGLGSAASIAALEVTWSTGEKTRLEGPFPANRRYRIERSARLSGTAESPR